MDELESKGHSDDAIELVKDFSSEVQVQYYESLASSWACYEPADVLLKIDSLPEGQIRLNLAEQLVSYKDVIHSYTPEQKNQ